ncbi:hypothetical protein FLONG3_9367 [Fusarium longipes]|uniref:Uncharacterized protein n=1 Tax=Fusarium longipes TaxID=694270 RepID=A0A395RYW8_9HYPO|nr:hypothetical protein FLONG3_9367 [Fusarium longipes]
MNLHFTLPIRSRPDTLPTENTRGSCENQTVSSPPKNELKVRKRVRSRPKATNDKSFFQNDTLIPNIHHDRFQQGTQLDESPAELPPKLSSSQVVADQVSLLQMVKENIRYLRSQTPSPEPVPVPESEQRSGQERTRSISSSYSEDITRSASLPSPPDSHIPLSNLGDLGKYSRTNDRLSGLRSSSNSSGAARAISHGGTYKALTDVSTAVGRLQRLPTPSYHRFEMLSSSEDLMSNTLAPQNSEASYESEVLKEDYTESLETRPSKRVTAHTRFDDLADRSYSESPSPSVKLPQIIKPKKRKASAISFRNISAGVKRSRVEVKKLANDIYRNGWDKLRQARENISRQRKEKRKQYSAWKELRRRLKPGDAIKGKHEKGLATFAIEKSMGGPKSWWKAGVEKYQAPEWMHFGK